MSNIENVRIWPFLFSTLAASTGLPLGRRSWSSVLFDVRRTMVWTIPPRATFLHHVPSTRRDTHVLENRKTHPGDLRTAEGRRRGRPIQALSRNQRPVLYIYPPATLHTYSLRPPTTYAYDPIYIYIYIYIPPYTPTTQYSKK